MKKLFLHLYNQLDPDNPDYMAFYKEESYMGLINYGHRIPGVYFFTKNAKLFPSFTSLLKFAAMIIDQEPDEMICCDTDMDSYEITIIADFNHDDYSEKLRGNKIEEFLSNKHEDLWLGVIIEPKDYHS